MNEVGLKMWTGEFGAALAVFAGVYGTGEERFKRLEEDGYDSDRVQECVNELCKLIEKYGGNNFEN